MPERIVTARRADEPAEHRALADAQILDGFAEVVTRGLADAVDAHRAALPEIDGVQIDAQDLVLVVKRFQHQRHRRLTQLPRQLALGRQEQVLDQLLGDRAAALLHRAGAQVRDQRTRDADRIDAGVIEKTRVLGGDDGVDQRARHLADLHQLAFFPHALEQAAHDFRVEDVRRRELAIGHAHLSHASLVESEHHAICRQLAIAVRERPHPDLDAIGSNVELSGVHRRGLDAPVAGVHQTIEDLELGDVEPAGEHRRIGVDARRQPKALPLETREDVLGDDESPRQRQRGAVKHHVRHEAPERTTTFAPSPELRLFGGGALATTAPQITRRLGSSRSRCHASARYPPVGNSFPRLAPRCGELMAPHAPSAPRCRGARRAQREPRELGAPPSSFSFSRAMRASSVDGYDSTSLSNTTRASPV